MAAKADVKKLVDDKIKDNKVMVFSKSWCGYCSKAKKVLRKYVGKELDAADLVVMEIENDRDCDAIQNYLQQITGARSVPRVFINGKFIGGGDDISRLDSQGKLVALF